MDEKEKLISLATEKYAKGVLSTGKAAEFVHLSVWEFIQLLKARKIPMNLTSEQVLEGVDNI
ncbi:UPF0175 family protein [Candidatus Micrarchaeota archaeon]|nr:UPF0175 family protein [Candidatus Micrarchaeota archaeon]